MKKLIFTCFLAFFAQKNFAQESYSFISDKKFDDVRSLLGYRFVPNEMEIRNVTKRNLRAGEVAFGITQGNLYVEGEGIKGVYNINNTQPAEYGFILTLINASDPSMQGHLKVILNDRKEADALIFKRSPKEKEIIYFQAEINDTQKERETAYFTDKNELIIPHGDSIWGKTIRPFLAIDYNSRLQIQHRFQRDEDMYFNFEEKTAEIDKSKPNAKPEEKKVKIVKTYFLKIHETTTDSKEEVTELELEGAGKIEIASKTNNERFVLTMKTKKSGEEIKILLSVNNAVSYVLFRGRRYIVRGL